MACAFYSGCEMIHNESHYVEEIHIGDGSSTHLYAQLPIAAENEPFVDRPRSRMGPCMVAEPGRVG